MKSVLVTLATESYLDQAKQLFASAYYNGQWKGDILLLALEVPDEKLVWFEERGIRVRRVQPFDSHMERRGQILFLKLGLFHTDFKEWDRVVYLDTDMMVRSPLGGLLQTQGLGGVQGLHKTTVQDRIPKPRWYEPEEKKQLYGELTQHYRVKGPGINGGLYVIDTHLIQANTYAKLCSIVDTYRPLFNGYDECPISLLFNDDLTLLDLSYNVFVRLYNMNHPDRAKGAILHFVGSTCTPPWEPSSPFYEEWQANLAQAETMRIDPSSAAETPVWPAAEMAADEAVLRRKFQQYRRSRQFIDPLSNARRTLRQLKDVYFTNRSVA